ncbi:alcohol dehydrogenase class-3 chain L-like [Parasteatoda tepidariorum]|uniref:alcohol dehydrogenase class-3 chain L-like n=1 Tax=Parasteatoda tepidariorum TaxID=114398 RepID=UPI00077FD7ED|nr:alcohol dehydrogenase class-3 chain L-like [Parasteatoda tepidariorum]
MDTVGKTITCRAAVVWKKRQPYSIETVVVDVPKKGEVRVKLASVGICHSDLHAQMGCEENHPFPTILGHEGAGIVESVGEDVERFKPGDLIVFTFESYCGDCDLCQSPKAKNCRKTTRNSFHMDGTSRVSAKEKALSQLNALGLFSEYTVTSQYNITKVNPAADQKILCLAGCCLPTGYGAAVNAGKVTPGSTCAVWGLGGVGMCVIMGCHDSGASKIIGIDPNPKKFQLAEGFGATHFLNPKEVTSVPETLAHMCKDGVDYCFVSVGNLSAMEEAFNSSHPYWGKTIIIGLGETGATVNVGVWNLLYGRQLMGTRYGSYKAVRDIPELVEKVVSGKIQLEKLITHRLPLDKINEGFELMKTGESLRSIIDFDLKE